MRVLVTGSKGMLGATLVATLEARGCVTLCHERNTGPWQADLTDQAMVEALVRRAAPDAVVNLAALTNVDECEAVPQRAYLANTRVVENIAAAVRNVGVPHLVQMSTDQVYDGTGPHTEDSVRLVNYYAFSKYAGELAAATVNSTVLRSNFFGRSRRPGRTSFSDWLVRGIGGGQSLRVFEDVLFNPLSLETVSDCVYRVLQHPAAGVFNLGSRGGGSKADFCYRLAEALDLPTGGLQRVACATAALKAPRPSDMRMDCSRFERAFSVTLPSLEREIASMRDHYHANT